MGKKYHEWATRLETILPSSIRRRSVGNDARDRHSQVSTMRVGESGGYSDDAPIRGRYEYPGSGSTGRKRQQTRTNRLVRATSRYRDRASMVRPQRHRLPSSKVSHSAMSLNNSLSASALMSHLVSPNWARGLLINHATQEQLTSGRCSTRQTPALTRFSSAWTVHVCF